MYLKFILPFILLNAIVTWGVTLDIQTSFLYSLRGIYSEFILGLFTIIFDMGSSVYCLFLLIYNGRKNRIKRKHIIAFLTTLLSYPLVLILLLILGIRLVAAPVCVDEYVSPSGHKSITLTVECYEYCYYHLFLNHFIFDKNLTEQVDINLWNSSNSRTMEELCDEYKKATKIEWINNENQIQLKVNRGENLQINTIELGSFDIGVATNTQAKSQSLAKSAF